MAIAPLGAFEKRAFDEFPITIDYQAVLAVGATIAVITVTALNKDGVDASAAVLSGLPVVSGSVITQQVRAGSGSASPYTLTARMTDSAGNKWEDTITMTVA